MVCEAVASRRFSHFAQILAHFPSSEARFHCILVAFSVQFCCDFVAFFSEFPVNSRPFAWPIAGQTCRQEEEGAGGELKVEISQFVASWRRLRGKGRDCVYYTLCSLWSAHSALC